MAKQITVTAYSFDELSDKAKDKAREWMRGCIDTDEWSDQVTEDAAQVGLKITGFDVGRGSECDIEFEDTPERVSELILETHGGGCDTRKAAMEYRADIASLPRDEGGDIDRDQADEVADEFLKGLAECYLVLLREAYEYAYSDEAVDETIQANEYLFAENGKRTAVLNA